MKRISNLLATITLALAASASYAGTTQLDTAEAYAKEVCYTIEATGLSSLRALATCYNETQVMLLRATSDFAQYPNAVAVIQARAESFGCAASVLRQASVGDITAEETLAELEQCDTIAKKKMRFYKFPY